MGMKVREVIVVLESQRLETGPSAWQPPPLSPPRRAVRRDRRREAEHHRPPRYSGKHPPHERAGGPPMTQHLVIYEQGPDSWGAYSPDLPGCTAVASSRDEVEHLMREAVE